jgi:hypothetical protein
MANTRKPQRQGGMHLLQGVHVDMRHMVMVAFRFWIPFDLSLFSRLWLLL